MDPLEDLELGSSLARADPTRSGVCPDTLPRANGGQGVCFGATVTPDGLVEERPLRRASKTDATRTVEAAYNLGDCLYFYAGHACPDFGDFVFVYEPNCMDRSGGDATPFDTGGLYWGYIYVEDFSSPVSVASAANAKRAYVDDARRRLSTWRRETAMYLAEHFRSVRAYVTGDRPARDDASGRLFHPANGRRAWTWEVRVHHDHPVLSSLRRAWVSNDLYQALRISVMALADDARRTRWQARLRDRLVVPAPPGASPHALAEQEMAAWL